MQAHLLRTLSEKINDLLDGIHFQPQSYFKKSGPKAILFYWH